MLMLMIVLFSNIVSIHSVYLFDVLDIISDLCSVDLIFSRIPILKVNYRVFLRICFNLIDLKF